MMEARHDHTHAVLDHRRRRRRALRHRPDHLQRRRRTTQQAQDKAQQLTQKFKAAGLEVPVNDDVFVRTLGSDGGTVCDNPASALGRATLLNRWSTARRSSGSGR